jgi:hypothetical protein
MLEFVRKLSVSFKPLCKKSTSCRSFLQMCLTDKNLKSSKTALDINPSDSVSIPCVRIEFNDSKVLDYPDCSAIKAREMVQDLQRYNKKLQLIEDIKNAV